MICMNISHTPQWGVTSVSEWDACWEGSPMPGASASIPDNWLCISDLANHPPVRIWEEACGRFPHSIPLGKLQSPVTPRYMSDSQCLYWNKNTLSFMEAAHRVLLVLSFFNVSLSGAEYSTISAPRFCQTIHYSASYSSFLRFWPIFLSCWVKCGWA